MPYPDNTIPDYKDSEAETLKEIQRILNDAKTGAAPILATHKSVGPFYEVGISDEPAGLPGIVCSGVVFNNTTGTAVRIYRNPGAVALTLPDQSGIEIDVLANANELSVIAEDGAAHNLTFFCVGESV